MDSDDDSLPKRLEKQVKFLDENIDFDVVNCNINVFDDNGIYGERTYHELITKKDFVFSNGRKL